VPRHPATDDELLLGPDLHLQPAVGPLAGHVRRASILGHDPLETAHSGGLEERDPAGLDVLAQANAGIRAENARQETAAFLQRLVEQRPAVETEQVEDLVDEGCRFRNPFPPLDLCLEQGEVRFAVLVEGDDLAVEDRAARGEPGRRVAEGPEIARRVLLAAGPQPDRAAVDDRLDAETVPLDLEQPVGVVERSPDECREHRWNEGGRRRSLGHGPYLAASGLWRDLRLAPRHAGVRGLPELAGAVVATSVQKSR
jgi:hypothetical protein